MRASKVHLAAGAVHRRALTAALLAGALWAAGGCGSQAVNSNTVRVDPTATASHSGGTDEIFEATQQAIDSLVASDALRTHLAEKRGNRIVLNEIVDQAGIVGYDAKVLYNEFMGALINNAGGRLVFLNRESVARERERQLSGQVKTTGVDAQPAGADLALDIQIRQVTSANTKALQYTFTITRLTGEVLWSTKPFTPKKRN